MSGARSPSAEAAAPPSKTSGLLYGLGLGGFVDGILLHEVLQWHHMVSSEYPTNTVAGLEVNTLADGLFHIATWFLVLRRRSPPWLPGGRDGERRRGGFTSDWCLPGGAC